MAKPQLSVRPLNALDFPDVLAWRADPTTRQMSRYQGPITEEGFRPVFDSYLTKSNSFIIYTIDTTILSLSFPEHKVAIITLTPISNPISKPDQPQTWEIGINLNPQTRGKGWSKSVLRTLLQSLNPKIYPKILATVKRCNLASIKMFTGVGFHEVSSPEQEKSEYLHFNYLPTSN